jgi:Zn-dependent metalloprotease
MIADAKETIDNRGSKMISVINCGVLQESPGNKEWYNVFWTSTRRQMVYGQVLRGQVLRSLAVNLDVVGDEMLLGMTDTTSRLEYAAQSGALNESDSDIAAYEILTSRDRASRFIFTPTELSATFYITLTQYLTRCSGSSASRRSVILAAQTRFRNDLQAIRESKIATIAKGFCDVGIH